jgi:hypothetical protein
MQRRDDKWGKPRRCGPCRVRLAVLATARNMASFFSPCALAATLGKPCRCILKGPLGARNGEAELGTTPDLPGVS